MTSQVLKVHTVHPEHVPMRGYLDDAGLDLYVLEDTTIEANSHTRVPLDAWFEFPPGFWGLLLGRSSTHTKLGLITNPGVIDGGFRGRMDANVTNPNTWDVEVHRGDRLAQLIPFVNQAPGLVVRRVERLEDLGDSDRGARGYGSTGL